MVTAKKSAIIYMVLLSLALLVPSLMIFTTDHQARSAWELRKLDTLPTVSEMADNPKAGFKKFDGWMNDHVGFGFQAIRFRKRFLFKSLGVTGDKYIVSNSDGDLFLTGRFNDKTRKYPYAWFRHNCINFFIPAWEEQYISSVLRVTPALEKFGAEVIYTAVPTKSVLLAEKLPRSTPKEISDGCKTVNAHNNGMMRVAKKLPHHNFYYPFDFFKERVYDDPLFFPNTAYHWAGESNWAFVEDFATTYGLSLPKTWPKGPCVPHKVRWDIGNLMGVDKVVDGCNRDKRELRLNLYERYNYPLNVESETDHVKVFALTNPYALNDKSAVLISNSFGPLVREQIAGLFNTTYHVNLNRTNRRNMQLLLEQSDIMNVDYVIVIAADFHYPDILDSIK